MEKENLIIIPGFATNSFFIRGAINYLNNFFTVYCIDLPGFVEGSHPLPKPDVEAFALYVESKLKKLGLPHYYLLGISLGYAIISHLNLDRRCKGILAIYPYLNSSYLKLSKTKLLFMSIALSIVNRFYINIFYWQPILFRTYLKILMGSDKQITDIIKHIDPKTYFNIAEQIITSNESINHHKVPQVIILSSEDELLDYQQLLKTFKVLSNKLIMTTSFSHTPEKLDTDIMNQYFPAELINKMQLFLLKYNLS